MQTLISEKINFEMCSYVCENVFGKLKKIFFQSTVYTKFELSAKIFIQMNFF